MDFRNFIQTQNEWSIKTFGPKNRPGRTDGVIKHLKKEIKEVINKPKDLSEWIDIILLALDGANVNNFTPDQVINELKRKQHENIYLRKWPNWKEIKTGTAIEHLK